jgi:hypothetical protein
MDAEELYWRAKIGDEIRESIVRMSEKRMQVEKMKGHSDYTLDRIINSYKHCENIARGRKDRN